MKRMNNYLPNISLETVFMKTDNSKANELNEFFLNFALQNESIYYMWTIIAKQYKNQ